ncbi:hypothetical protein [Microcoleus sp. B4-D4]|uniref:hypothetical protein n=1 Tax=Microcoleus sp. B4-D4 TaxID=2818667 RepID=UPI002FCFE87A
MPKPSHRPLPKVSNWLKCSVAELLLSDLLRAGVGGRANFERIREILVLGRSILPIGRSIQHRLDE